MHLAQADSHRDFARGLLQEAVQQLQDALLLFERPEQIAHFLLGEMQIGAHEIPRALHVNLRLRFDVEQSLGVKHGQLAQHGVVGGALLGQPPAKFQPDPRQLPAAEIVVHVIADRHQLVLWNRLVERHHAVAHHAVLGHHHHQHAAPGKRNQLHLIEHLRRLGKGRGDAQSARHLGEHVGGALHLPLHRIGAGEFVPQPGQLMFGDASEIQGSDIALKRLLGGNSSGGSVRLRQVPFFAQIGHYVANAGGAELVMPPTRQRARSHRFARLDVGAYDRVENVAVSGTEVRSIGHGDTALPGRLRGR